jgi:hypothetical protein
MTKRFSAGALLVLILGLAGTDLRAQAEGTATANIVKGLVVEETAELQFGSLIAGGGGTVTVGPDGSRVSSVGITLMPAGFSAGSFDVYDLLGRGNRKFAFTVLDTSISVTRQSGSETMIVDAFTHDALTSQPWNRAPDTINVGARLTIGAAQRPGVYVGTYRVRVDEQ